MIHVITGQTATGKTAYALELAKKLNAQIINADARQIYKHLDIVTGKDKDKDSNFVLTKKNGKFEIGYHTLNGINIWLYDMLYPDKSCTSYDYATIAKELILNFIAQEKNVIIVGGSIFYIQSLLYPILTWNVPPNLKLREALNKLNVNDLQRKLEFLNKELYESLNNSDKNNPHRLIRKIEISKYKKNTKHEMSPQIKLPFKINAFIFKNQDLARKKIESRVNNRILNGAVKEIEFLREKGYTLNDMGLKSIGYAQLYKALNNELSQKEAIADWINKELQYSKRQLTLLKTFNGINWNYV